ncbi:MAG: RNA polymerase sigma factor [Phycisphaerales bacterium]
MKGSDTQDRLNTAAAAMRGDAEALRAVWQENRRWVAAVLLAHKPKDVDVEDLLQDVAMTLVKSITKVRDASVLGPWLRTVAINAARAAGRQSSRRQRGPIRMSRGQDVSEGEAGATWPPVDEEVGRGEAGGRLAALSARLPEGYREPLLLKCVQGMSYREIGTLLGLPETTVETRIARGRRMLREMATAEAGEA